MNKQLADRVKKLEQIEAARELPPLVVRVLNDDSTTAQVIELRLQFGERK